ncbi:MAG: hypothetical protein EBT81_02265, partial [Gammaproteobacteria bacterium]|nr:hypothetical protein [Gammaproteobacteria bacterium]NBR16733.1 hypothetical protein [Gammaproteobacteria bacterium]
DPDWSVPPEPRIRDTASANYAVIGVLPPRDGRGREAATAEEAWDRAIAALPQAAPAVNEEPDQV